MWLGPIDNYFSPNVYHISHRVLDCDQWPGISHPVATVNPCGIHGMTDNTGWWPDAYMKNKTTYLFFYKFL